MNEPNHILTTIMPTWAHLFRSSTLRRHVKGSRILNRSLSSLVLDGAFSIALLRAGRGQLDNAVWQLAPKDFQNNEMSVFSARHCWKPHFPEKERDVTSITCVYICLHMQIMTSSVRTKKQVKFTELRCQPLMAAEKGVYNRHCLEPNPRLNQTTDSVGRNRLLLLFNYEVSHGKATQSSSTRERGSTSPTGQN